MFNRIGNLFERRKLILKKSQDKKDKLKESLKIFLRNRLGDNLTGISLRLDYSPKDNGLTITTDNKIIANELSLLLADMNDFLKTRDLKLDKILIK